MLYPDKILAELQAKRDRFFECEASRQGDLQKLAQALKRLTSLPLPEIEARLAGLPHPGALPTAEHEQYGALVIPFAETWSNHRQAREWALEVLHGTPTFVVDGSQIPPAKDVSIPVAVVQVGWFENPHRDDLSYVKDVDVEILTPDELADDEPGGFPGWRVNWRRFKMEIERLVTHMQSRADAVPKPLCFLDGSVIVSFAQHMRPDRQRLYTDVVVRLLDVSKQTGVPLVGYVDTPHATDLVAMLTHMFDLDISARISDAGLLRPRMGWGDRTQVYICARDDAVLDKYYEQVCFVYLKTTADHPPARIEFPRWIYEAGEHERMLDLVRAECVVGIGYPYPAETSDAVAVFTMEDRERFYRLFQEFAEREGLTVRFSQKSVSKRGRRI